jgi:subtilase family serine protease
MLLLVVAVGGATAQESQFAVDESVETQHTADAERETDDAGAQAANLQLQSIDAPASITANQGLVVQYTIKNVGDEEGTESFVDLIVEGTNSSFDDTDENVRVPAGGFTSGTLTFDNVSEFFSGGETINFTVQIFDYSDDMNGTTDVGTPDLQLQSIDAPDVIDVNQDLDVDYTIENVGTADGVESFVDLTVDGTDSQFDDTDEGVLVPDGETRSGTLTFDNVSEFFSVGETVSYSVSLFDFGDSLSATTDVGDSSGPVLQLQSIDAPKSIGPSENLTVDYTIENVGGQEGTESFVDLIVEGTDSSFDDTDENVTVPAGGNTSGTLTLDNVSAFFGGGDTIRFTVGLFDYDDSLSGTTDVGTPDLRLQSLDAPASITAEESLTVDYSIGNVGTADGIESFVDLFVQGTDSQFDDTDENVLVPDGGTVSGTLTFDNVSEFFNTGDSINYTVQLFDYGDSLGGTTDVGTPNLQLQSINAPDEVSLSDNLTVEYTIGNVGNANGTESFVDLLVEGTDSSVDDTDEDVLVPAGGTTSGTLTFDNVSGLFSDGDTINYTVQLFDYGDTKNGTADVGVPDIQIQSIDTPNEIAPDENFTVDYTLENVGSIEGSESFVDLLVQGTNSQFDDTDENVTVPAGDTASGTLTFDNVSGFFSAGDTINYTVQLFDFGDAASGSTDVVDAAQPNLQLQSINAPDTILVNETLAVDYTIENVGGAEGTESFVDLLVEGTDTQFDDTDENVTVPAGDTASGTLTFDNVSGFFDPGDTINFTVDLFDFGDGISDSTDVEGPPALPGHDPPRDLNDDGLYEDADGDDTFDIFDVQTFFDHFTGSEVQGYSWAYNFGGNSNVTILDVQALFDDLTA